MADYKIMQNFGLNTDISWTTDCEIRSCIEQKGIEDSLCLMALKTVIDKTGKWD